MSFARRANGRDESKVLTDLVELIQREETRHLDGIALAQIPVVVHQPVVEEKVPDTEALRN